MTKLPKLTIKKPIIIKYSKTAVIHVFRYALIICLGYMILYPLLKQIAMAVKNPYDIGSSTSVWIPERFTLDNLIVAISAMEYLQSTVYTVINTGVVMFLQMFSAAFAGYAFARLKFKGSGILFGLVMLTIIVPPQSLMLPQYVFFRNFDIFGIFELVLGQKLNLIGSPISLYLLAATGAGLKSGLFIYIFRQFFRGLPKELEEAAYVDGAGFLRTFFGIVLPTAKPGFLTVGVLSFVWNWNDSYFTSLFNPNLNYLVLRYNNLGVSSNMRQAINRGFGVTYPATTTILYDNSIYDLAMLQVCSLLVIVPIIVGFLFVQKSFVEGVERSGIVG